MSPLQLAFAQRVADSRDRLDRGNAAVATMYGTATAMGEKVDWSKL